jgi:predicted HicB family RNase H-like nuclease
MRSEAQKRADAKYDAKTYDRITYKVRKEQKRQLAEYAASRGMSVSAVIAQALRQYITADNPDIARDIFGD